MKAFLGALEFQENEYEEFKELYEGLKTTRNSATILPSVHGLRSV
ncbi:hypothetical protein MLS209_01740 [Helicobacter pylori]